MEKLGKGRPRLSIVLNYVINQSFGKTLGTVISLSTKSETLSTYTLIDIFFKVDRHTILFSIVSVMGEGDSIKVLQD